MLKKIVFIIRVFIGFILLYSGFAKILNLTEFIDIVNQFDILPLALQIPFAALLPAIELTIGISLIFGIMTKVSAFISTILFLIFTVAVIPQLLGPQASLPDCGCFGGTFKSEVNFSLLLRDLIFFFISYFLFLQESYSLAFDNRKSNAS